MIKVLIVEVSGKETILECVTYRFVQGGVQFIINPARASYFFPYQTIRFFEEQTMSIKNG